MDIIKKTFGGNDILRVLRIKPFLFLMVSEFFSQFAFNMQHFVFIFIIYGLTRSNTAVSGVVLSFTIPAILFSLISGVYVDRWSKKNVLLYTNLIRAILILPLLISGLHLGFIYTLTFLIAVATQFFLPAESSIIPHLVPKRLILTANAIFSMGLYGTMVTGYIFAGPVLLLLGRPSTIILLSVLFFVSAFFILLIKMPLYKKWEEVNGASSNVALSLARETKEIFTFIRKARKVMHAILMLTIAQAIIFMFAVLAPGYMTTILDIEIENLSWILIAPAALGMGICAVILGSVGRRFNHKWLSVLGFMISGVTLVLLPFGDRVTSYGFVQMLNTYLPHIVNITMLHIIVVMAFIIGFAIALVFIPSNATIQIETGDNMRGRVYGFLNALIGAVSFLPVALAGGLADILGVGSVITGFGFLMVVIGVLFLIFD